MGGGGVAGPAAEASVDLAAHGGGEGGGEGREEDEGERQTQEEGVAGGHDASGRGLSGLFEGVGWRDA